MKIIFGDVVLSDETFFSEETAMTISSEEEGPTELTKHEALNLLDLIRLALGLSASIEQHPFSVEVIYADRVAGNGADVSVWRRNYVAAPKGSDAVLARYAIRGATPDRLLNAIRTLLGGGGNQS